MRAAVNDNVLARGFGPGPAVGVYARGRPRGARISLRTSPAWHAMRVCPRCIRALAAVAGGLVSADAAAQPTEPYELELFTIAESTSTGTPAEMLFRAGSDETARERSTRPTLAGQLAGLPGLIMQEGFGGIDPPRLSVRGSGLQSAPVNRGLIWLWHGLPLNATDGTFYGALLDPALLGEARIEAGAAHPLAATSALGGAIDFAGMAGPTDPGAWASVGSDGSHRVGLDTGQFDVADGRIRTAVARAGWDGWRPQSAQERLALVGEVRSRWGPSGPMVVVSGYAARAAFEIPGPLTREQAVRHPRTNAAIVATDRPRRDTDLARLAMDATWSDPAAASRTRVALAAQATDDRFRQLRANGTTETVGEDLTALVEVHRSPGAHAWRTGMILRSGSRDQARWAHAGSWIGARFAALELEARHAAAWIRDRWSPYPNLVIDSGISALHASRVSRSEPTPAAGRFSDARLAGDLGVLWHATDALSLRARVMRGVEPPTFDDLLATHGLPTAPALEWMPLQSQYADTIEAAALGRTGALTFACTAYASRWSGELLRLADATGTPLGTRNARTTRHAGVETALRWRLAGSETRGLDLAVNHTWSRAIFASDAAFHGRHLAGLPPHAGRVELRWSAHRGLVAAIGTTWIGGTTWADHANTLGYGGHTLVHARVGWLDRRGWSVFIDADNVGNRATIASTSGVIDLARQPASTALFLPGLPRQLRLSFAWSL